MRLKELLYLNDGGKLKGLDNDLLNFHDELYKLFPNLIITSGKRYGNGIGKLGNKSRHNIGQAIDIAPNEDIKKFLLSNDGRNLMRKYNLGFLDETNPDTMKKTGATGPHFHIGKDSTLTNNISSPSESKYNFENIPYISLKPFDNYNNDNIDWNTAPNDLKDQIYDNIKMEQEFLQADENKRKLELENEQIRTVLEQKQFEKQKMLSMIPQAQSIEENNIRNNYTQLLNTSFQQIQ